MGQQIFLYANTNQICDIANNSNPDKVTNNRGSEESEIMLLGFIFTTNSKTLAGVHIPL